MDLFDERTFYIPLSNRIAACFESAGSLHLVVVKAGLGHKPEPQVKVWFVIYRTSLVLDAYFKLFTRRWIHYLVKKLPDKVLGLSEVFRGPKLPGSWTHKLKREGQWNRSRPMGPKERLSEANSTSCWFWKIRWNVKTQECEVEWWADLKDETDVNLVRSD